MSSAISGRRLHVLHVVRCLVEILQELLQQTGGEAFLGGGCSYTTLTRLFVPSHGVLACPRYFLAVNANMHSLGSNTWDNN